MEFIMQSALSYQPFKHQDSATVTGHPAIGQLSYLPLHHQRNHKPRSPTPVHSKATFLCPLFPKVACLPAAPGVPARPRRSPPSRIAPRSVCKAQALVSKASPTPASFLLVIVFQFHIYFFVRKKVINMISIFSNLLRLVLFPNM